MVIYVWRWNRVCPSMPVDDKTQATLAAKDGPKMVRFSVKTRNSFAQHRYLLVYLDIRSRPRQPLNRIICEIWVETRSAKYLQTTIVSRLPSLFMTSTRFEILPNGDGWKAFEKAHQTTLIHLDQQCKSNGWFHTWIHCLNAQMAANQTTTVVWITIYGTTKASRSVPFCRPTRFLERLIK